MRYSLARLIFIAHGYFAFKKVTGQYSWVLGIICFSHINRNSVFIYNIELKTVYKIGDFCVEYMIDYISYRQY